MKRLAILATCILTLGLAACDEDSPEIAAMNKANLSAPETVGVLPDGRKIQRVTLQRARGYPHYVYFVGNVTTVQTEGGKKSVVTIESENPVATK